MGIIYSTIFGQDTSIEASVQAFNALPRNKTVPTGPGPNHWHFSLRSVDPRLDPPDIIYLISPTNHLMHVAAPAKGLTQINALPNISEQADVVSKLLLDSFAITGVLKGGQARLAKFAPWTWSCNDKSLADAVEEKFKELGVREELCIVQRGVKKDNKLSDELWGMMKANIREGFVR